MSKVTSYGRKYPKSSAEVKSKVSNLVFRSGDASRFVGDLLKCPRLSCGSGLFVQAGVSWLGK